MQATSSQTSIADIITPICFAVIALAAHIGLRVARTASLQRLADRYQLSELKNGLPADFPLRMLGDSQSIWSIHNAFSGPSGGDSRLVFDLRIGSGRYSYIRTVVARRFINRPHNPVAGRSLWFREYGPWRIVYFQRGILRPSAKVSPARIDELWNLLAGPDFTEHPQADHSYNEILIRPRKP